jgi:hypothetical protein
MRIAAKRFRTIRLKMTKPDSRAQSHPLTAELDPIPLRQTQSEPEPDSQPKSRPKE